MIGVVPYLWSSASLSGPLFMRSISTESVDGMVPLQQSKTGKNVAEERDEYRLAGCDVLFSRSAAVLELDDHVSVVVRFF